MVSLLVHVLDCGLTSSCTARAKSRFNLWTEQLHPASGSWQVQLMNRTSRAQCFFLWCSQSCTATPSTQLCPRGGLAALTCVSVLRKVFLVWPGELDVCMAQPWEDSCISWAGSRGDRAEASSKGLLAGTHLDYLTWRSEEISFRTHLSTVSSVNTRDFFSTQALRSLFFPKRHKAFKKPQLAQWCANNSDISMEYCVWEHHHQKRGCEISVHSYKTFLFSEMGQKMEETEKQLRKESSCSFSLPTLSDTLNSWS